MGSNGRKRFAAWALAVVLAASFAGLTAGPAFAAATPAGKVEVTSFEVLRNGKVYTGKITKGMSVKAEVNVVDLNVAGAGVTPIESGIKLNTTSFSIEKQSNIAISNLSGSSYTITFTGLKYTGIGDTLGFNISYTGGATPMDYCGLTLSQCTEYVEPDKTATETPDSGPDTFFILKDVWFGDGGGEAVYAGRPFTLTATILATNGASAVDNVTASFSLPTELTFAEGSSITYIGTVSPGASTSMTTVLLPGANIQEGSYDVAIDVSGVSRQSGQLVSSPAMTVSIPVLQPERFEIFNTMLPTDLTAGMDNGMGYGSVTFVNQGRGGVSNVTFEIVGDGLWTEEGRLFVGNVGPGEQRSADFNLMADFPGQIEAVALATYENTRGEIKTLEYPFTVNVMEGYFEDPGFSDPGFDDPGMMGERTGPPNWVWILIAAAAAIVAGTWLVRRRRKKKLAAEAALDVDDDDDE